MRVLIVVGRPATGRSPATPMPTSPKRRVRSAPSASSPCRPTGMASPPRATTLLATLPAPPSEALSRSTRTTGTGASGEMRLTLPHRKWSIIRSPRTTTRAPTKRAAMAAARARSRAGGAVSTWSRGFLLASFRLDGGLLDQHDRDVIDDRVASPAGAAHQAGPVARQNDLRLAQGTSEDFQQLGIEGHPHSSAPATL